MFNQLPTTGKQFSKTHNKTYSKSESQTTERSQSIKSLNYTRKSSRDLLRKIKIQQQQEKGHKLVLLQSMFKQSPAKTERLKQKFSQRLESANKVKMKTIINIPNKKIQCNRQCKPPSKPTFFKKHYPQHVIQTQVLMNYLIQKFERICQDKFAKLFDVISYFCFQQSIKKISGVHYLNITKPIWNELFQAKNCNWLSVLSFLLALFNENLDKYYPNIIPTTTQSSQNQFLKQTTLKSQSSQKRKIIIKKSFSKTKQPPIKTPQSTNPYLTFTPQQMSSLSSKYSYLKTEIMNKLKQQISDQKQNTSSSPPQQLTLKVHIKNQLTSIKINKHSDPITIAKKFAAQQKLDTILQNKLCYFLSKELKNI